MFLIPNAILISPEEIEKNEFSLIYNRFDYECPFQTYENLVLKRRIHLFGNDTLHHRVNHWEITNRYKTIKKSEMYSKNNISYEYIHPFEPYSQIKSILKSEPEYLYGFSNKQFYLSNKKIINTFYNIYCTNLSDKINELGTIIMKLCKKEETVYGPIIITKKCNEDLFLEDIDYIFDKIPNILKMKEECEKDGYKF